MADNVHNTILDLTVTAIEDLNLTDVADVDVVKLALPSGLLGRSIVKLPAIAVCPVGVEQIPPEGGDNKHDTIIYPTTIFIVDAADGDLFTNLKQWLGWREDIIDQFIEFQFDFVIAGVKEHKTNMQPGPIIEPSAFKDKDVMLSIVGLLTKVDKERRRA